MAAAVQCPPAHVVDDDDDDDVDDVDMSAMIAAPAATASSSSSSAAASSSTAAIPAVPATTTSASSSSAHAVAAAAPVDVETQQVRIPPHRYTPLRDNWEQIMRPLVEHMKLAVRVNPKKRCVEMRKSASTTDPGALAKGVEFVSAFMCGFEVRDAIALLRLDNLRVESFDVTDVKPLKGDHLSRAIGRIAGMGGRTKHAIENATRTRIVVADARVHILGSYVNIQVARDAICSLILGAPPGKVYNQMKNVAARLGQRY